MAEEVSTTIGMRTCLQSSKVYFKWTVENWDLTSYSQQELRSEIFKVPETDKICFLAINIDKLVTIDTFLTVYLEVSEQLKKCVVSARVVNNEGTKVELEKYGDTATVENKDKKFYPYKFKIVEEYFTENTLVFLCQIDYVLESYKLEDITDSSEGVYKLYREKMKLNHFDMLHKNQQLCDVTFSLGQYKLKAHAFILATISPYFLAMFNHDDLKESQERIVDLTNDDDVTPENFEIFLDFVYGCTSVYDHKEIVCELLILGNKFDVPPLKISCEHYLVDTIKAENCAELLLFADKYDCLTLKNEALGFAKAHLDAIKKSNLFKDICKNVDLITQLI